MQPATEEIPPNCEVNKTTPNLKKFFGKMMDIKVWVLKKVLNSQDPDWKELYEKLNEAFRPNKPEDSQ